MTRRARMFDAVDSHAGVYALALLAAPLNGTILDQLCDGPMCLAELRAGQDSAPQSTVRARLKELGQEGLTRRQKRNGQSGVAEFSLTEAGAKLLDVATALEGWLCLAPSGPIGFGSVAGKTAIKSLAGGWSSTVIGLLAAQPLTLLALSREIDMVSYPSLSRRLASLHRAGHVRSAGKGSDGGRFYEPTEWLQQGIVPLAAAVRWERTHFPDATTPVTRLDTEAGFLLAFSQLEMAPSLAGRCRTEVVIDDEEGLLCGAVATIEGGKVVASATGTSSSAESWASGSTATWANEMVGPDTRCLTLGGDLPVARGLVGALRRLVE